MGEDVSNEAQKTIAFFPEAAFGPALNSVGIAQAVEARGHKAVFLSDPGFVDVYKGYGFEAHPVNLSEPMPPEQMAKFWDDFINGHIPNFRKSPYDQVDNYVKDCWTMIVDTAKWAEKDLPGVLDRVRPDVICVDNVILFPAIKQSGKPWVRIISCSENEIEDEGIPPHLSGCAEDDQACHARYRAHFNAVIKPIHDDFNQFLASAGEAPYPLGQFFEASPYSNLLLYPEPVKFARRYPLDPGRFQYLEGCVRFHWTALLNTILCVVNGVKEHGHGGTMLLVSPDAAPTLPIHTKFDIHERVNILGSRFVDFLNARHQLAEARWRQKAAAHIEAHATALSMLENAAFDAEEQLGDAADFVARLTAVDGALVLTSDLRVLGFGAEIVLDTAVPVTAYEVVGNPDLAGTWPEVDSQSFGMRHRSALRCVSVSNSVAAFVVSQDNSVSFIWKKGRTVLLKKNVNTSNPNMVGA